jgi:hypothetical protein
VCILNILYIYTGRKPNPEIEHTRRMGMVTSGCMDQCRTRIGEGPRLHMIGIDLASVDQNPCHHLVRLVRWRKNSPFTMKKKKGKKGVMFRSTCICKLQQQGGKRYRTMRSKSRLHYQRAGVSTRLRLDCPIIQIPGALTLLGLGEVPWPSAIEVEGSRPPNFSPSF